MHPEAAGARSFRLHSLGASLRLNRRTDTTQECREYHQRWSTVSPTWIASGSTSKSFYPTFSIQPVSTDVSSTVASCRAYNQWMANVCMESGGRIRWVVVPPLGSAADVAAEIAFGKANGAVGVMMHGY